MLVIRSSRKESITTKKETTAATKMYQQQNYCGVYGTRYGRNGMYECEMCLVAFVHRQSE